MKKISYFLFLLVLTAFRSQGQITLEHTYSGVSAGYVQLPLAGYKYFVMDVTNNQCRLYNNDHSLWKTITLSIPANYFLYDIAYVSENLFNTDNSIELLYVSYNYNSTGGYYTYDTRIATETGNVLLSVPGGGYSAVYNAQTGSKLFIWVYDYSQTVYTVNTMIYSIPGQIVTDMPEVSAGKTGSLGSAFPNPATDVVTIPYTLPTDINQAELKLYDGNGNMLRIFRVDRTFDNIRMQAGDLPNGMYFYRLEANGYKSESNTLIISR